MFTRGAIAQLQAQRLTRQRALELLQSLPGFAEAMLNLHEAIEPLRHIPEPEVRSPERLERLMRSVDLQAAALLPLVADIASHGAFIAMLQQFCDQAWNHFNGLPGSELIAPLPKGGPLAEPAAQLSERFRHWTSEGYRRIAKKQSASVAVGEPPERTAAGTAAPLDQAAGNRIEDDIAEVIERRIQEDDSRAHAELSEKLIKETDPDRVIEFIADFFVSRLDNWAYYNLMALTSYERLPVFEQALRRKADLYFEKSRTPGSHLPELSGLRLGALINARFAARISYWIAEALQRLRLREHNQAELLPVVAETVLDPVEPDQGECSTDPSAPPMPEFGPILTERAEGVRVRDDTRKEAESVLAIAPVDREKDGRARARRAIVDPILANKGWTVNGWASRAGVQPSVVYDYYRGTSKRTHPKTKRDLAQALGIDLANLPD